VPNPRRGVRDWRPRGVHQSGAAARPTSQPRPRLAPQVLAVVSEECRAPHGRLLALSCARAAKKWKLDTSATR
jgi:hypothetical protein